jgi:ATP-dependent helicase/nuclease subunit A
MTRARDTLILTGSMTEKKWQTLWTEAGVVTVQKILAAKSYADWLGLWFAQQSGANPATEGQLQNLCWRIADDAKLANGWGETPDESILADSHPGSRGRSPHQLESLDEESLQKLRDVLTWKYRFGAATKRKAKSSVTALRREAVDELDDEAEQVFPARQVMPTGRHDMRAKLSGADAGTAHHKFFQHVSLEKTGDVMALETEAERLEAEKILTSDEASVLDLKAVAAFWNSPVGQKIRRQASCPDRVKREFAFTGKFNPNELDEILELKLTDGLEDEFIVVQGVADLVVLLPEEIWLVDFKTDDVTNGDFEKKKKGYAKQLKLYASALGKIYGRQVTNCWLHFLSAQRTVKI